MWVEKRIVTPSSRERRRNSSSSSSRDTGSRPLVGSSSSRSSARWDRARVRANFTFMPAESWETVFPSSREKRSRQRR